MKTFKELFAGTGIEPTTDENGGVHYNFKATLKNEPMKLYTEEQVITIVIELLWKIKTNNNDTFYNRETIKESLVLVQEKMKNHELDITPIELPTDEEIEQEAYYKVSDDTENPYASFKSGAKWIKEQIINQNKYIIKPKQ